MKRKSLFLISFFVLIFALGLSVAMNPSAVKAAIGKATNFIGTNDSNNAASTSSVAANADGSILERLEQLEQYANSTDTIAGKMYATSKIATAMADDLFDVDGGAILIHQFVGVVTTELAADGNNLEINLDADSPWIDKDFSTAVAVEGDTVGTYYVFVSAGGDESVLTPLAGADDGAETMMTPWFSGEGMIEQGVTDADCTGAITWYIMWSPFDDGTTVTAQ